MQLSTEQLDGILAAMGEGLLVVDKRGKIIFINQTAGFLLKIAPTDAMGKNVGAILHCFEEGRETSSSLTLIDKATTNLTIIRIRLADNVYCKDREGKAFPVGMVITPLLEEEITGAVIIFRDLTDEREIDTAKSEFVSLASHQLRTPLSTINWYTEMLQDGDTGSLNKEQRAYVDEICRATTRMTSLVNDFLSVSRIELGTLPNDPKPTQLFEITDTVLSELVQPIKAKSLTITKRYDKNAPLALVDPSLMLIVFQNLLANAVQYTPKNGAITIKIKKQNDSILVTISDTGYGIPKKDYPKIFTKLFRADNVREKETTGNGLGLYIVKEIIKSSHGKILFESNLNEGTSFFITLPTNAAPSKNVTQK